MLAQVLAAPLPLRAHDGKSHGATKPQSQSAQRQEQTAKVELLDLELLDRHGQALRFKHEVVAGRIVAIDFVYTSCGTVCPIVSAVMAQIQDQLGESIRAEVSLISISIDPVRDTPAQLDLYARKFGAAPGWTWLTGHKNNVDRVLIGLGAYTADVVDHPPMLVIGDPLRGVWSRIIGLPSPDNVVARLNALVDARQAEQSSLKAGN